ncbi:MAG: zinc-dependent metalloprotease [Nitriliruptoraceae bacterium]
MAAGRPRLHRSSAAPGVLPLPRAAGAQGSGIDLSREPADGADDASNAASSHPAAADGGRRPLIDRRLALRTASLVAPARRAEPARISALRADVRAELPVIDAAARGFTDLGRDLPETTVSVVGRTAWVRANLDVIAGAFEPLRERLEQRATASRRVLGLQLGGLLGLLSTKVLGQFVLPLAGAGTGQLLVVGPNVLELADEHGRVADDIRRTVVLHEITHRLQFDANPWLGDHLRGLVERYLQHTRIDGNQLAELLPRLPSAIAAAKESGEVKPLLETVLTEEQVEVIDEAQGLMSLLEGHGNATMYGATDALVEDAEGVREALASRQGDVASKVLNAVAGLELKRRQYREGEVFVRHVLDHAGTAGLNQAFAAPEHLPRSAEITDPDAWLERVSGT